MHVRYFFFGRERFISIWYVNKVVYILTWTQRKLTNLIKNKSPNYKNIWIATKFQIDRCTRGDHFARWLSLSFFHCRRKPNKIGDSINNERDHS